jgi:putative ABC transport system permease protein
MLIKYIILIFRNLWRFRLYSLLNIVGLAIALAVATLIFIYVRTELSYDRSFPKADRIYRIANYNTSGPRARNWANGSPMMAEEITKFLPEIESIARLYPITESVLEYYQDSMNVTSHMDNGGFFIDSTFLDMFDVKILYGNKAAPIRKPYSLILTESLSRKFFGTEIPLGKSIYIRGEPWEITAICQDFPEEQHFHPTHFMNWQSFKDLIIGAGLSDLYYSRGWSGVYTYALMREDVNVNELVDKLMDFRVDFYSEFLSPEEVTEGGYFLLQSLTDIHLKSNLEQEIEANGNIIYVLVFSLAAIFILVIAGVNYVNLATVKTFKRMNEIGIRKVAGARRMQLVIQFLGESLFITLLSGLTAILIMDLLLPLFNRITEIGVLSLELITLKNSGMLFGMVILLAICSGLYPALFASRISPIKAINELKDPGSTSNLIRVGLVILQFTVSVFMIIATIILYRQMNYFLNKDMGWDKENIIALTLNGDAAVMARDNPDLLKEELTELAFITGATITSDIPGDRFSVEGLIPDVPRDEEFDNPAIRFLRVDEDFIPLMGIEIMQGRNLSRTSGKESEFILNKAAVKAIQLENPLGIEAETYFGQRGEIVGVSGNFHYATLRQIIEPLVLEVNYDPESRGLFYRYLILRLSPGDLSTKINRLQDKMEDLAKGYIMQYTFLDENMYKNYKTEQRLKELLRAFAILAILISCMGLFGLSAFSAELKTKEMGIRKAMGASVARIAFRMIKNFLVYVIISLLVALPLGFISMNKWLQNFAYHINIQWQEFLLASLLAITIASLSVAYYALRSGTANPVDSLRYE